MTQPVMPAAARAFVDFASLLRAHGFALALEQTTAFLAAIDLLGPRNIGDIEKAAYATLAPPFERHLEFDALFRSFFMGQILAAPTTSEQDEDIQVRDADTGFFEPELSEEEHETGEEATTTETLSQRSFELEEAEAALRQFAREAPRRLPRRKVRRFERARAGDCYDLRQALREAVRYDGDVIRLPQLRRRQRLRQILLLIDVSGSMKQQTELHLRLAHALVQSMHRAEVFTFGTRLTRISRALRLKREAEALAATSGMVADWDGGTRIGDALGAFMKVPRYVGLARGAVVIVLSDGLERGDHSAMTEAVVKLSRCAWQLHWLSPLAGGAGFEPQTAALRAIVPYLDSLSNGASIELICDHILNMAEGKAA